MEQNSCLILILLRFFFLSPKPKIESVEGESFIFQNHNFYKINIYDEMKVYFLNLLHLPFLPQKKNDKTFLVI